MLSEGGLVDGMDDVGPSDSGWEVEDLDLPAGLVCDYDFLFWLCFRVIQRSENVTCVVVCRGVEFGSMT